LRHAINLSKCFSSMAIRGQKIENVTHHLTIC
jgi:hypothetical protein